MQQRLLFQSVTITIDASGTTKNVDSVGEAALWLFEQSAVLDGEKFKLAKQACLDALDGKNTCTECRDAFIEAVKGAHVYVDERRL
ncbi:DUF982 domain-containing protein [Phyllobacterium endophyticum]|uniref:DUF982 domain-containing protein n=1 Tax=Phyllobacterium endophyticum TaxID=1149773 RepID=A0A2P7AR60_9HYPH|nr:DUF982 domain-containing protein [Phyllobacterium endophyticum]MBB3237378.1 hypothetical protein [Phyllobacterium endophyticum]PSH56726.1 hypothetical protein CU100_15360 [Phyllobacterium endophyticum]TYR44290.1 DUF982 domain-containing protein [Phyllobacterium endophyticum]